MTRVTTFLMLGLALSAIGCSSDEKSGGTKPGTGGSNGTGGSDSGVGTGGGVNFSAKTVEFVPGAITHESPLAGVEACIVSTAGARDLSIPCATSDANGEFTLTGLAPGNFLISCEKAQYERVITAVSMGTIDIGVDISGIRMVPLLADGGTPVLAWDPSVQQDPTKGSLSVFAMSFFAAPDAGRASPFLHFTFGVTFAITPTGGHDGPYYADRNESWVSGATTTAGGPGASFLTLDPGEYTITATHGTMTCRSTSGGRFGWWQDDGTSKAGVVAGAATVGIGFNCD